MSLIQAEHIMNTDPGHARVGFDPKYEHGSAFIHGQYCAIDAAAIPIVDCGFMHADAAYDVVSASKGLIFRLEDHQDRFEQSCKSFRLCNPYSRGETAEILTNLVVLAGTREAYIWWCVTRGVMPDADQRGNPEAYQNMFYAFAIPYMYIAGDEARNRGLDLAISREHIRIPPRAVNPAAKNFHWMDMKLALFEAHDQGRDSAVLCDAEGYLAESPGANIFLIKDRVLYTPDSGCLEGITRRTTLELAAEIGLPAREEKVHADQLLAADEAFITSTAGGIMPVNSVDGIVFGGSDGPGELTACLHNLYWEKRWDGWLGTPVHYAGGGARATHTIRP
jgi:branched-chain amino acid aminotransferase